MVNKKLQLQINADMLDDMNNMVTSQIKLGVFFMVRLCSFLVVVFGFILVWAHEQHSMGLTDQKGDNQSSLIEGKRNGEKNWWKNLDQNSEWVAKSLRFIRYQKNGNNREELFSFNFINHQSWVADVRLLEDLGKLQGGQPLLFPVLIDKNEFTFWQMVTARKGGDDFAQLCFQKVHQIPLHRFTLYLQKFEGEFRDQEHLNLKQIMFSDGEKVLMLLVEFERVK